MNNVVIDIFKDKSVGVITAAGTRSDATEIMREMNKRGAKSEWIPLQSPCRNHVRDPNMIKLIEKYDYIYFTGGSPGSLHSCLFGDTNRPNSTTPILETIKKKDLIAGSSAGSLIQPKLAILTTGFPSSYETVVRGSMAYSYNGTEILRENVLIDVHFSERGRQGRLHVLQFNTKLKWGFGIDEDTSLVTINQNGIIFKRVTGKNGVFITQNINKEESIFHYLTEGDQFNKQTGEIIYASYKKPCTLHNNRPTPSTSIFRPNQFRDKSIELIKFNEDYELNSFEGNNPVVRVTMKKSDNPYCGNINGKNYTSYKDLKVSFKIGNIDEFKDLKIQDPFLKIFSFE